MHPHNYINLPALTAHGEIDVLDIPFKHSEYFNFGLFFHHVLFARQGSCIYRKIILKIKVIITPFIRIA